MTLAEHTSAARQRLIRAGIPASEAPLDARLLAQHTLGWTAARFLAAAQDEAPDDFAEAFGASVDRRVQREPVAYITGEREFWGVTFEVSPAVLIPRPETELIVESVLDRIPDRAAPLRVADVGTGSGCIAVALATEYPFAKVVATDTSAGAIAIASRNIARHSLSGRVAVTETDLIPTTGESFAVIVSNPPYVSTADRASLQPEVRDFEPASALFAGSDGLDVIRRLLNRAFDRLIPGGLLFFEFGFGQRTAVEQLIADTPGLTILGVTHDLQSIPRVAVVQRD